MKSPFLRGYLVCCCRPFKKSRNAAARGTVGGRATGQSDSGGRDGGALIHGEVAMPMLFSFHKMKPYIVMCYDVYIYIYMYVCIYIYIILYVYTYHTRIILCMYIYIHTYVIAY